MVNGETKSGFKFEINEGIGTDFRVMEAIVDSESEDASDRLRGAVELVRYVLGADGKKALYDHLYGIYGTVPTDKVLGEVTEILQIARDKSKEIKN